MTSGIDISHNDGIINWDKVILNPTKIDFVYIKATQGVGYKDPQLLANVNGAKRVGIKFGYYHFCSLNSANEVTDATAEANYFLSVIKTLPKSDLPLILDIELNEIKLKPADVLIYINTFFNVLKTAGYTYALYSYTPFLNENLPANHNLGNISLWIAAYTKLAYPVLPNGWSKYWIWQYSSDGVITGITTKVDLNKMV